MSFFNLPVFSFLKNGVQVPVSKDTVTPANSAPLPVELTGASGDVAINAANLHMEVQTSGFGANPDSVQITDGTNTLAIQPDGSLTLTPTPELTFPPTILNIPIPTANAEQSYTIPSGARQVELYVRTGSKLKYAFVSGQSGTTYATIEAGACKVLTGFNITSPVTIYFQATRPNSTLELSLWN